MTTVWVLTEGHPHAYRVVGVYAERWIATEEARRRMGQAAPDKEFHGLTSEDEWTAWTTKDGECWGYRAVRHEVGTPGGKP